MTYRNPVIPGFHPDPSVCRVGNEFFLVTSSFIYSPGVPIFRSSNLVDWTQIGNVLDRTSQLDLTATKGWSSLGIYAPTLRHHDGQFFMITTNVGSTGARSFFVTSEDPSGPWSDPVAVPVPGIDPDLAWDPQGNCWVHFSGLGGIARYRIDSGSGAFLEGPDLTWSGTGLQYPESPHLYERDGIWYLLIAEGGTYGGHCVSVARGPSPVGPWEAAPANPILTHRSTDSPIQNTGHADLVQFTDGSWWMVLLGVRPKGIGPGFHTLGRETFLVPVRWVDGWPVPGDPTLDMATAPGPPAATVVAPTGRDEFELPVLGHHWVGVRQSPDDMSSLAARPGWLVLRGGEAGLHTPEPTFVGRRQQHHYCRFSTRVEAAPTAEAGLSVLLDEAAHYDIAVDGDRVVARARIGPLDSIVGSAPRPDGPVTLTIETGPDGHGPDSVALEFEDDAGTMHTLARLDGRYLSTEATGGFLGRMVGMYAVGGEAAFDWFDYAEV
jgi:xylan 1,4-beta-xylosidase